MTKTYKTIIVEKEGAIGRLILNRPEKLNALNMQLREDFEDATNDFAKDPEIKVFIIKGAGRAFSAGYDMSGEEQPKDAPEPEAIEWLMRDTHPDNIWWRTLWDNPKISIGQVHGFCLAGGGHMMCHADILYCSADALFGYPPVRYASVGVDEFWPTLVGLRKSMEHMVTGNMMNTQTALRVGFVNEVFPTKEELEAAVETLAKTITKVPMAGLFINKRAVHQWYENAGLNSSLRSSHLAMCMSYGSNPKTLPHGIQDVNRVTREKGMRAGFEFMNKDFLEEDAIARPQMKRPDRKA